MEKPPKSTDGLSDAASDSDEIDSLRKADDPKLYGATTSTLWKGLTVVGVIASGVGFIAQFFGLRGLTFPCSIAQLLAILVMALIRAGIRRRLGRVLAHFSLVPKYELDCLAAIISFAPMFRDFHQPTAGNEFYDGFDELYQWTISVPEGFENDKPFCFILPTDPPEASEETVVGEGEATSRFSTRFDVSRFERASSQQLLKVRERLGNLCRWTSPASETALSLVNFIELFMDTFFPLAQKAGNKELEFFDWAVRAENRFRPNHPSSKDADFIIIPDRRSTDGKWAVDIGKVDAVLSLWMATIEVQAMKKREKLDVEPERARPAGLGIGGALGLQLG